MSKCSCNCHKQNQSVCISNVTELRPTGVLYDTKLYLAGSIDNAPDDGIGWRKKFRELSCQKGLSINFLDPTDKPANLSQEIGEEKDAVHRLKLQGKFDEARRIVIKYRRADLRMVDKSDIFVVYVNTSLHMCGSYMEVQIANLEKKPILVIIQQGKKSIPDWLLSYVTTAEIFDTVEECVQYLVEVDNAEIALDDRWVIF